MKIKCAAETSGAFLWRGRAFMPVGVLYGCRMVAGWCLWEGLPGGVCGKDCRTGCRMCRYVAGQVVIWASDGRRNGLSEERSALVGRTVREAVWMIAGRVPGMAAAGYSRLFRVSGCCRTTTGATGPPFSCRALGAVTRPFPRQAAAGSPPCSACGAVRGKSSRV